MEENNNENIESGKTPPSYKYKFVRVVTLTFLFLVLFFSIGYVGVETTSSSKFCASCHEMNPQYYTWKASTHSEVDCVSCHVDPGLENQLKSKAGNIKEVYKKYTDSYIAPIRMPKAIPDEACEKCHNIYNRNFSPSGDLIIPHEKHKEEGIECTQCHSGLAHGKVADRKITYKSDYGRWSEKLGQSVMSDLKYTRPLMDTCMDCHRVRKVTLECSACHTTSMLPEDHTTKEFKEGGHGKIEPKELPYCDKCHSYMSKVDYDLFEESSSISKFLNKENSVTAPEVSVSQYAKTNTFCKDCHSIRPQSHNEDFFLVRHGHISETTEKCFICHDNRIISDAPVTNVACGSCHPSSHNREWKSRHPVPISEGQRFSRTCLTCHVEANCGKCHSPSVKQ